MDTPKRRLTDEAQAERDDFDDELADRGCTCFISPPCSWCTHPGNPHNQDEDETCWQDVCSHCDDTGDVHRANGEYMGRCTCQAGEA